MTQKKIDISIKNVGCKIGEFDMPYTMDKFEFMNEKDLSVNNINEQ